MLSRRQILATVVGCSAAALAQSKPNFSGRWQIDTARTTHQAPDDLVEVIDHREPKLRIETTFSMNQSVGVALASLLAPKLELTTDTAGNSSELPPGIKLLSNSKWQGDRLVTNWRLEGLPNGPMEGTWTRYLADGGKTMLVDLLAAPGHERVEAKLIFAKK